jgi:hypothetical protein
VSALDTWPRRGRAGLARSQKGLVGSILSGWELSGVTRYYTGRRLTVTAGTNTSIFAGSLAQHGRIRTSLPGQLGTSPENGIAGPSYFNTDLSVFKNVRFADKGRVAIETNLTSSRFGAVTEFEPPRIAQLGAKFSF